MANTGFLVEHAMTEVWAEPSQDRQHVIQPARYTSISGGYKRARIQRFEVNLPVAMDGADVWHHVYHIGAVYPILLSLESLGNSWVRSDLIAMQYGVMLNVFLESGVTIPLCHTWLRRTVDGNILLAVEIRPSFDLGRQMIQNEFFQQELVKRTLSSERLYFRCYRNERAQEVGYAGSSTRPFKPTQYVYKFINTPAAFTQFLNDVNAVKAEYSNQGKGYYFIDGFMVGLQTGYQANVQLGKWLSYIHDETVLYDALIPFSDVGTYRSDLDNADKLLVMIDAARTDLSIHYHDDVDIYLCQGGDVFSNSFKAAYFGEVTRSSVRQVTQNAYGLKRNSVLAVINEHSNDFMRMDNVYIRLVVREGGKRKGLPFHQSRLNDLYKLPLSLIKQALYGVNSVMPEWRAVNLEKSAYMALIGAKWKDVTADLVISAYGYHALQDVCYNELLPVDNAGNIDLNHGYHNVPSNGGHNASVWCYTNGKLVDVHNALLTGDLYTQGTGHVTHMEVIPLPVDQLWDGTYIDMDVSSWKLAALGFRAYVCSYQGQPLLDWQDVTGGVWYQYTEVDGVGTIAWNYALLDAANLYPAVRVQETVHSYNPEIDPDYNGVLRFNIRSTCNVAGVLEERLQRIASDTLDVFMNGEPLIENIDYYVHWPEVVIVKRNPLPIGETTLQVRHYGNPLTTGAVKHREAREAGFTKLGILSSDAIYNLRNDRNLRVIVDGALKDPSTLRFAENALGLPAADGRPYSIQELRYPLQPFVGNRAKQLADDAALIDSRAEAYLTPYINPTVTGQGFIDGERYQVVSPLISVLLHAMVNFNFLGNGELDAGTLNDVRIAELAEPYWFYLDYEPILNDASVDYVNILPHQYSTPMSISQKQYSFLELLIYYYLKGAVDLTPHVTIQG